MLQDAHNARKEAGNVSCLLVVHVCFDGSDDRTKDTAASLGRNRMWHSPLSRLCDKQALVWACMLCDICRCRGSDWPQLVQSSQSSQ